MPVDLEQRGSGVRARIAPLLGPTAAMFALTLAASGVNYASNIVFSRVLTPASFGDLTALLALTVVAAVPSGAAQTVMADRIAAHMASGQPMKAAYLIRHATAHLMVYVAILGCVYLISTPFLDDALNLQSANTLIALTPMLLLSFFTPLAFGILQGLERFVALGLVMLWIAVSRIAFGVPWALSDFGGGPGGALLGMAIGNLLALIATGWVIREYLLRRGTGAATAGLRRRLDTVALSAGGAFVGFAILSNFDVVLAKITLDPAESGNYAALATIGKIIFFLPGAVALLMVPRAARARVKHGSATRVLRLAALAVTAATLALTVPAAIAPEFVVRTMFGGEYVASSDGVLPIALAGAGTALINLLVVYTVAIGDRRWLSLLLAGVAVQVATILTFGESAADVAIAQAVTVWLVLVVNELLFHPLLRAARLTSASPK
ncbi:MAG: oligosaccharide flippase family protein [Actinomycetota bacterium]|nr:oligosaccharide flippase family protein [Actinomycetota bacterium]